VRLGYGNVVAAGSILRKDYPQNNKLIFAPAPAGSVRDFVPAIYPNMGRIVENNILYLANLAALEAWYTQVRRSFFETREFGPLLYAGVMGQLGLAKKERLKRLRAMAQKSVAPVSQEGKRKPVRSRQSFYEQMESIEGVFSGNVQNGATQRSRDVFLEDFQKATANDRADYIEAIRHLPPEVSSKGVECSL
jgi:bifunctional UDP-N-acetylglucosamine pyrophosphorylase/glucosamine-1-phosphate N-acetyltransferase